MTHRIDSTLAESLIRATSLAQRADVFFDYMKRRGQTNYDMAIARESMGEALAKIQRCTLLAA